MTGRPAGRALSRRHALRLAGAGLTGMLVGCGDDAARPAGDAPLPTAGSGASPGGAGALVDRLAGYHSAFRFTPTNTMAYDDEAAAARARVAMRIEMAAFLAWARDNGHPDIRPALPRAVVGEEYLLDPLMGNDESLDTVPLAGARQPLGRLIPDDETVKSYPSTRQAGFALTMLKMVLSRAEYARLVADSPLVRAAGGKSVVTIYPFSAPEPKGGDSYLALLPGVRDAFRGTRRCAGWSPTPVRPCPGRTSAGWSRAAGRCTRPRGTGSCTSTAPGPRTCPPWSPARCTRRCGRPGTADPVLLAPAPRCRR